ncbi:hypothetical protein ILUMI_22929 [Ignelater luminosus]|uniref:DDE-1 domain-containing protein n=1 Tax=Ignelater luminosus TaxID=2038154 RepID=A0A8K0G2C8_IGNLU|nr:hypothetical protein ILUMI_22929 [Ignelater luminosus]
MRYPSNKEELRDLIRTYVVENNLETPFKNGRYGLDWYYNFMSRHKGLSFKKSEHLQIHIVSEKKIDNPAFVFNADESAFSNDPSRIKAIGERGKPLSRVSGDSERESTSVLACISFDGSLLPPFMIFKGVVKELRLTKNLPKQEALLSYDEHKSHIRLSIIECAIENKISLVKLPSHLTDRLQPLDKGIFGPVKISWEKKLIAYGKKHMGHGVGKLKSNEFTELLREVWRESITENNIKNLFLTTGVFPVNSGKFPEEEFNPIELKRYKEHKQTIIEDSQTLQEDNDEASLETGSADETNKETEIAGTSITICSNSVPPA